MAVDLTKRFIHSFAHFLFNPAMCLATLVARKADGGTGLVADDPYIRNIILDYLVLVTLVDLRYIFYLCVAYTIRDKIKISLDN